MDGNGDIKPHWSQEMLQHELGHGIVRWRQRKGWSQSALAGRLKVTRHRLGKWELGIHAPSLEELVALLELLGVTFEELVLGRSDQGRLPKGQRKELSLRLKWLLRSLEPLVSRPSGDRREARR